MSEYCDHFDVTFGEGEEYNIEMWQGLKGPYYTPSVDSEGNLTWTNNGALKNPPAVNIRGPAGESFEIQDTVQTVAQLPVAPEIGTAYGVGTAPPFDVYVFGASGWTNYGPLISVEGPQGPPGEKGADGPQGPPGEKGEDGADGKDAVITPTQIEAGIGYNPGMVNPNLLDNWYFANPVNQRGVVSGTFTNEYYLDRWKVVNRGSLTLGEDFIKISADANYALFFLQYLEFQPKLPATVSVLTSDGLFSMVCTAYSQRLDLGKGKYVTAPTLSSSTGKYYVEIGVPIGEELSVKAAKLELGSVQTLARQVNGNWVLNEIPNYGEQLARCRRYFQRIPLVNTGTYFMGMAASNSTIYLPIPVSETMRNNPAISCGDISALSLFSSEGTIIPTAIAFYTGFRNIVTARLTVSEAVIGEPYMLRATASTYIELSAEL